MKIEIGESLILSYLKHVKKCVLYQNNWKSSSQWENFNVEAVERIYEEILTRPSFDVFKGQKIDQLLRQAEIDAIGMDASNTVYAIDVAYHENGLQYGGKEETKDRVVKKLLRSYLILRSFFPDKNYEILFVSPKVHNATEQTIRSYMQELEEAFCSESVKFRYVSNGLFLEEILLPTLDASQGDSDTCELFVRAAKMLKMFGLFSQASTTQKTKASGSLQVSNESPDSFTLEFHPENEKVFKERLLQTKSAKRTWYYSDGRTIHDVWDANNFSVESNLRGNILSNNKVRNRAELGLVKLKLEIE